MKNWFVKMAVHVGISQMEVQNAFVLVDIAVFTANIPLVELIRVIRPVLRHIKLFNSTLIECCSRTTKKLKIV